MGGLLVAVGGVLDQRPLCLLEALRDAAAGLRDRELGGVQPLLAVTPPIPAASAAAASISSCSYLGVLAIARHSSVDRPGDFVATSFLVLLRLLWLGSCSFHSYPACLTGNRTFG